MTGPGAPAQRRWRLLEYLRQQKRDKTQWTYESLLVQLAKQLGWAVAGDQVTEDLRYMAELGPALVQSRQMPEPLTKERQTFWSITPEGIELLDGQRKPPAGLQVE
jgi:hypothetical protein